MRPITVFPGETVMPVTLRTPFRYSRRLTLLAPSQPSSSFASAMNVVEKLARAVEGGPAPSPAPELEREPAPAGDARPASTNAPPPPRRSPPPSEATVELSELDFIAVAPMLRRAQAVEDTLEVSETELVEETRAPKAPAATLELENVQQTRGVHPLAEALRARRTRKRQQRRRVLRRLLR